MRLAAAAGERDEIFSTLNELYLHSWNTLANKNVSLEESLKLSDFVTNMKMLLTDLEQIENRLRSGGRTISSIKDLKERYCELESLAKEAKRGRQRKTVLTVRPGGSSRAGYGAR